MNPRRIALWRHEQIEPLLDPTLTLAERRKLLLRLSRAPVRWTSGAERPLSEATLYRWLRTYQAKGLSGLAPRARNDRGRCRRLERSVVERAIALLREEPERSLTMLGALLQAEGHVLVPRSTLHRHLKAHPAYARLCQLARGDLERRLRRRFSASEPHEVWQIDSKGPFLVRLEGRPDPVSLHVVTILDDCSRAVLAVAVVERVDLAAAVRLFRAAARLYGLPKKLYADRASIFDSRAFREGLAELGVHRIRSKPHNPPARGKIEAYHRVLRRWFIVELRHQIVHDLDHLERLLIGVIESIYMEHPHRGLHRQSPRQVLSGRTSQRQVSHERLWDSFLVRTPLKAHPKTGEITIKGQLLRVPREWAGRRVMVAFDPVDPSHAFVESPDGLRHPLTPAIAPSPKPADTTEKRGEGRLQALYDAWQGRQLPQAQAGFGLPEFFALLEQRLARRVPKDEHEAHLIQDFYRARGPLSRAAAEKALDKIVSRLGTARPLATYLEALTSRIVPPRS